MEVTLSRKFRFQAAHYLPGVPEDHKCRRMHGHSYEVTVYVRSHVDPATGMGLDYDELAKHWQPLHERYDHHALNDCFTNPTSEVLAQAVFEHFKPLGVARVRVREGDDNQCDYYGGQS